MNDQMRVHLSHQSCYKSFTYGVYQGSSLTKISAETSFPACRHDDRGLGLQPRKLALRDVGSGLSDPQAEDSLYDIESMRRFVAIELLGHIPDESTNQLQSFPSSQVP